MPLPPSAPLSVTTAIRRQLLDHGNRAMRLASLFELVRPQFPELTRTHFRAKVVRQMFDRGEVIKMLMTEEVRGRPRSVYGMRLKNNIANRKRAEALGVTLHRTAGVIEKADASAEKEVPAVEGGDKLR